MKTRMAPCTPPCKRPEPDADLKRTVGELKAENQKLKLTIDELGLDELKPESGKRDHAAIQELKGESEKLKAESAELKAENNKLERESEKPKQTNDELTQMVHKLKGEQEKSKHTIDELNSKWFYADQENSRLKQQNKGLITQVHELVDGPRQARQARQADV